MKLSKTAIRRRKIVSAIEAVLGMLICSGVMLGTMAFIGWLAEMLGRVL